MDHANVVSIILVGFGDVPVPQKLQLMLGFAGYPVPALRELRRIPALPAGLSKAAIVVFDADAYLGRGASAGARGPQSRRSRRGSERRFGRHYALMNPGAIGNFEAQGPALPVFEGATIVPRQAHTA
jgi:hypothetical protein